MPGIELLESPDRGIPLRARDHPVGLEDIGTVVNVDRVLLFLQPLQMEQEGLPLQDARVLAPACPSSWRVHRLILTRARGAVDAFGVLRRLDLRRAVRAQCSAGHSPAFVDVAATA